MKEINTSKIRPLFWQHGESHAVLGEEIKQMHQNRIGGFIVEARPHPDYLGYGWWKDLDYIIEQAKKYNMEVWIFDDGAYPSGSADGKLKMLYPEAVKVLLAQHHIDVVGPRKDAIINVQAWLEPVSAAGVHNLEEGATEELVCVSLAKRSDDSNGLDFQEIYDLTPFLHDGKIMTDIPQGHWRIFIITKTHGGESWTKDYVNPIDKWAVSRYIDIVYNEHYKHYSEEFGKTIKGFFSDEPRFGNVAGYENTMWRMEYNGQPVMYPYSDQMMEEMGKLYPNKLYKVLPYLWCNESQECSEIHYSYMNIVSRLFAECFTRQIGQWCKEHGVKYVGHFIEDNGAHARLGYGPGHFFRAIEPMDASGLDMIYQVVPHQTHGRYATPFGNLNGEFFYWGITKMASSAAHIQPNKKGETLCEIFGACGWQTGLKMMKWYTDHVCVRGVNLLVPHAFSPKKGDVDCPPHFYARGENPQWKYFDVWSGYANRICNRLSGGIHIANAAVVYHAEAEWGGEYQPFEKIVHCLAVKQIDCDVIPVDLLTDSQNVSVAKKKLLIAQERYDVLIVPYSEWITKEFAQAVVEMAKKGLPIIFSQNFPQKIYYEKSGTLLQDMIKAGAKCCLTEQLPEYLQEQGWWDIKIAPDQKLVRSYHYEKDRSHTYFLVNEDTFLPTEFSVSFSVQKDWVGYDPMEDIYFEFERRINGDLKICLEPYQSIFICERKPEMLVENTVGYLANGRDIRKLEPQWAISLEKAGKEEYVPELHSLGNLARDCRFRDYSGTIVYRAPVKMDEKGLDKYVLLSLGEVYEISEVIWNGVNLGSKIAPPYRYDLTGLLKVNNLLEIKVTNTLVNQKGTNLFDRSGVQEPTGLVGPVELWLEKGR